MNRSLAQSTSSLPGLKTIIGIGAKSILLLFAVSAPPEIRSTYWRICCCMILLRRRLTYHTSSAATASPAASTGDTFAVTAANRSSSRI